MTPEKQQELNQHLQAIAKILYAEAEPENLDNLEGIEKKARKTSNQVKRQSESEN
jgi:hypothetical protein